MVTETYKWKRFWYPRGASIQLIDRGFLPDPDVPYTEMYNPAVVPFASLAHIPCLVLLAEPGMGKTMAMRTEQKEINTVIAEQEGQVLWLDLRSYATDGMLIRGLFENPIFRTWEQGTQQLHVFLDSLDEALLRIDTIASLLIDELQKYPVERLSLRIACRTADWPKSLEDGLKQLWPEEAEAVGVYQLAPLRQKDVIEAAQAHGLNTESFLREVDRAVAVPLAIKPVTLDLLLTTFRREGQLPGTQAELYQKGCSLLCEETTQSRRDARRTGAFSGRQRMLVAGRVAAATIFANRYAIWTDVDRGDVPKEDVLIDDLLIPNESLDSATFSRTAIDETLATGLFSSLTPQRVGWSHLTYAEFLAAWYLTQQDMTIDQMMSLLIHPIDPLEKIVPQLHETAAWLASMVPMVFRRIMHTDPTVLLRSDVATADIHDRKALVASLLKLFDEELLRDDDRESYAKLAHPELADQLRPYIVDSAKGWLVRRVAVDIAEACELRDVQDELIAVVLDRSESIYVRINAAYAISRIGDEVTKAKLRPLALGQVGDDPDDELRGCGLRSVWPQHITAEELFAILDVPRNGRLIGAYNMFVSYELPQRLQPSDLPIALKWIAKQPSRYKLPFMFRSLINTIFAKAWEYLSEPGVLAAFAEAALSRSRYHEALIIDLYDRVDVAFEQLVSEDEAKRHQIVKAMLSLVSTDKEGNAWYAFSRTPLILSKDVPWLSDQLLTTSSHQTQVLLAHCIERAFDRRDSAQAEMIFTACQQNTALKETFAKLFGTITLDSPEAKERKDFYYKNQLLEEERAKQLKYQPVPAERIVEYLDKFEAGDTTAWWQLNYQLALQTNGTNYSINEIESDLTRLPGWQVVDEITKTRIIIAAKEYVIYADRATKKWFGTSSFPWSEVAGYRALRLLAGQAKESLAVLPQEAWERWIPIILTYPTLSSDIEYKVQQILIKLAYLVASDELIKCLVTLIDRENKGSGHLFTLSKIVECWDETLEQALLVKVKDKRLKPENMGQLLEELFKHKVPEATIFAETLIPLPLPKRGISRARAVIAARLLMTYADDLDWSIVWSAIQRDVIFGREIISAVGYQYRLFIANMGQRLTEYDVAELYLWFVQQYPHAEDPKHDEKREEFHKVTFRDEVAEWRDTILNHLKQRGTPEACQEIQRIAQAHPELDWLKWTLLEAQAVTRRSTWIAPLPHDIFALTRHQQARLVNSGEQLVHVILESLQKLDIELQAETYAAQFLWDKCNAKYRPKDENSLSDWVKLHLDRDIRQRGIIVNREVELRPRIGGKGERTDIHVDAVVKDAKGDAYDTITVIIEVKGSWHREVKHAMRTQLVERYLHDNPYKHGVYLVGWYNCPQWDPSDSNRKRSPKMSREEAQQQFDVQAQELSRQGVYVKAFVLNTALR